MAITFSNVGLAEPSTVTKVVGSVTIARGSTSEFQEILVLGDPQTSNAMTRVVAAAPVSTEFGAVVRIASGPSSAADLLMRPVFSSTSADNPVSVTQVTSPWVVANVMQSSVAPSSGSSGVIVRPVIDIILTTASSNAFASTTLSIQSSGAALRSYVTAYSITSTDVSAKKVAFYDSTTMVWPVVLGAVSGAVTGANLAVSAPAYLFRTGPSNALALQTPSSAAGWKVAVSYFRAP